MSGRVLGTYYEVNKNKNQGERVSSLRQREVYTSDDPVQECEYCRHDHNTRFRCVHEFSQQEVFACLIYVDPREESNSPEHGCDQIKWARAAHHTGLRHEQQIITTTCDCEEATRKIDEQVAKRGASCTMCQPPARQRFPAVTTGSRSVDHAVPRTKRRERYGNEKMKCHHQGITRTTRCWTKVTSRVEACK